MCMRRDLDRLFEEISCVLAPKLWNIQRGTATEREKQIAKECLGYLSLIKHSSLSAKEIKSLWDSSGLTNT